MARVDRPVTLKCCWRSGYTPRGRGWDAPESWTKADRPVATNIEVNTLRASVINKQAAVFYPRVRYSDGGVLKYIGPTGIIAGLMARIDSTPGVWKAPAGPEALECLHLPE